MGPVATDIGELVGRDYREGFVTDIESETLPPGLDEQVIRFLSAKKTRAGILFLSGALRLTGAGVK